MNKRWIHLWSFNLELPDQRWRERYQETAGCVVRAFQAVADGSPEAARRLTEAVGSIDALTQWAGHRDPPQGQVLSSGPPAPSRRVAVIAAVLLAGLALVAAAHGLARRRRVQR